MNERAPDDTLEDHIGIQQAHDGRWAWVDEKYDGAGTRVVEWIEGVELAQVIVHVEGVKHLQLNANDFRGTDGYLDDDRWVQSSRWVDLEEMR